MSSDSDIDLVEEDRKAFLEDAWVHLEILESGLLELEDLGSAVNPNLINEMFRAVHSVKGGAGLLALSAVTKLTHQMENLLGLIRSGKQALSPQGVELLFEGVDALRTLLLEVRDNAGKTSYEIAPIVAALQKVTAAQSAAKPVAAPKAPPFPFNAAFMPLLTPGDMAVLRELSGRYLYELALHLPDCGRGEEGYDHPVWEKLTSFGTVLAMILDQDLPSDQGIGTLVGRALFVSSAEPPLLELLTPADQVRMTVIPTEGGPVEAAETPQDEQDATVPQALEAQVPQADQPMHVTGARSASEMAKRAITTQSVRVDVERLDFLMDIVGELV
ncbi:MAG: Hpt domain-containing protein, partial [Cyanobacteria bacterium REEB65]|nr:Hpt domain-containing protein [Cyanobacteria bacterium REEB65]